MKALKYISGVVLICFAMLTLTNCKKDDEGPSITKEEQEAINLLTGTWTVESVTQDGDDPQIGDYSQLQLTINGNANDGSGKTYTVVNGAPALQDVSGASWSFVDGSNFTVIEREDGFLMSIQENTESKLVLRQDVKEEIETGARVATLGKYIYTFSK